MKEVITISINEYNRLLKSEEFLDALENYGVDNWDCYCDAYVSVYGED